MADEVEDGGEAKVSESTVMATAVAEMPTVPTVLTVLEDEQGKAKEFSGNAEEVSKAVKELQETMMNLWSDFDRSMIEPFMTDTDHAKALCKKNAELMSDPKLIEAVGSRATDLVVTGIALNSKERKAVDELKEKGDADGAKDLLAKYISAVIVWAVEELSQDKFFKIAGLPMILRGLAIAPSPATKGTFYSAFMQGGDALRAWLRRAAKIARNETTHLDINKIVLKADSISDRVMKAIAPDEKEKPETVELHRVIDDKVIHWAQIKQHLECTPNGLHKLRALVEASEKLWEADRADETSWKTKRPRSYSARVINMFRLTRTNEWVTAIHVKTDLGEVVYHRRYNIEKLTNRRVRMLSDTHNAGRQFTVKEEFKAVRKLRGMITRDQFADYMVLGQFAETSEASGVMYIFRRMRPTVAFASMAVLTDAEKKRFGDKTEVGSLSRPDDLRFLAGLCLHPVSYYHGTFVGAYCPTDDVIAHLLKMRVEEPKFWGKSNHHYLGEPELGM